MRGSAAVLGVFVLSALAGCSTLSVEVDYDPATDFSRFETWGWLTEPKKETETQWTRDPFVEKRFRTAIATELSAKGFHRSKWESPDFLVAYYATSKGALSANTIDSLYGYQGGRKAWQDSRGLWGKREEGTVILDMVNASTRALVWRGWAGDVIDLSADAEEKSRKIRNAVTELLEDFPPQTGE